MVQAKISLSNERGQTGVEMILLMTMVFVTVMVVLQQVGPRLRTALIEPLHDAVVDATRFGLSPKGNGEVVEPKNPEGDTSHPFNRVRLEAQHL